MARDVTEQPWRVPGDVGVDRHHFVWSLRDPNLHSAREYSVKVEALQPSPDARQAPSYLKRSPKHTHKNYFRTRIQVPVIETDPTSPPVTDILPTFSYLMSYGLKRTYS